MQEEDFVFCPSAWHIICPSVGMKSILFMVSSNPNVIGPHDPDFIIGMVDNLDNNNR
jgi:hypothetical protein